VTADFAAAISQATLDGRELAESLMTATGIARRATGATTVDPDTDADVPEYADLFESKCKIQSRALQARDQEVGGRTATTVVLELHLPIAAPKLTTGDMWHLLTSAHDPQLPGRVFEISAPVAKEYATARRYEVTEVVA
jgi:hypothetical protein